MLNLSRRERAKRRVAGELWVSEWMTSPVGLWRLHLTCSNSRNVLVYLSKYLWCLLSTFLGDNIHFLNSFVFCPSKMTSWDFLLHEVSGPFGVWLFFVLFCFCYLGQILRLLSVLMSKVGLPLLAKLFGRWFRLVEVMPFSSPFSFWKTSPQAVWQVDLAKIQWGLPTTQAVS